MNYLFLTYVIVAVAGFGGGGVAARNGAVITARDPDNIPYPPNPKCPTCPPLFGALLAVIIWAFGGHGVDLATGVLSASVVGFTIGTAGGTLSNLIVGTRRR